uniref:Uncharacterized protein n=1 Tax=Physcomitrium patens TaxID=3218 RepID=A0A2K1IFM4_PHYPA|nr:hypothetical protein PHYPA_028669 [Physcomitrium patens]
MDCSDRGSQSDNAVLWSSTKLQNCCVVLLWKNQAILCLSFVLRFLGCIWLHIIGGEANFEENSLRMQSP